MLLIYEDEATGMPREGAEFDSCIAICEGLVERVAAKGQYVDAAVLQPTSTATSVRVRDGRRLVTDGPFAETREGLGGYLIVRADSLDEALAIAAEHPIARVGAVEVRPLMAVPFREPALPLDA